MFNYNRFILMFTLIGIATCSPTQAPVQPTMDLLQLTNNIFDISSEMKTIPCTCAVFFSDQFKKGSTEQPTGNPVLLQETNTQFSTSLTGQKQCTNKCLETIVKHLPNSYTILCATADRDLYKERAYLFIQGVNSTWINSNLSAGREYCCKSGEPYKCPIELKF